MHRGRVLGVLAVLATVALASCGGDDGAGDDGAGGEAAAPSTTTDEPATTTTAPALPERFEARFDIIGGPDWLAEADGSIWVKVDDGRVVRIDPATNEVVAEIQAGSDSEICQGIGAGDGAVWTCDERDLVRIDPATNEVAATVPIDKHYDSGQIPVAFDHAWALSGDGSTLVGVRDDVVDVEFPLPVRCSEIAATADALWAACIEDGSAVRIDPATGAVTHQVPQLDGARQIAAEGQDVWVGHSEGVTRIDGATGEVVGVAAVGTGQSAGLFASDGGVWVRKPGTLSYVDQSLTVVDEVTIPEESGGSVRVAFGSVWTSAYDDAVVFRVSPG